LLAWVDYRDGNPEIYGLNLSTREQRRLSFSEYFDERAAVYGNWIVWQQCDPYYICDIFVYNWLTQQSRQITNTVGDEKAPDVGEHIVVYQGDRNGQNDIYAYDLDTGIERQLDLPGNQLNPNISGDYVAFDDTSNGNHVKLWHLPSNSVFTVTTASGGQYGNDIDGNRIVYTDVREGQADIYMTTFNVEFPPAAGTLSNTQLLINKKLKSFSLLSNLTLRVGNNGLNPPNEVVSFKIGNASATIQVGKFRKLTNSLYAYAGTINNVKMEVLIRSLGNNQYSFQTAGTGYNFSGITNPVMVEVSVRDDFATASVNAVIK
jgi:beta propeller repeat protein